jgi:cell division protein FtsI/penicillin-binding protein 2
MSRLLFIRLGFFLAGLLIIVQLFRVQVLAHGFYTALAQGQHELFRQLFPERGRIYATDGQAGDQLFLLATNRKLNLLYAEPYRIKNGETVAKKLAPILGVDKAELAGKLSNPQERYRVLAHKLDDDTRARIEALKLDGIGFSEEDVRFYPEGTAGAQMLGFVGASQDGKSGRYGLEGWFDKQLTGEQGYLETQKDSVGQMIAVGDHTIKPAKDGSDLVLSIDRTVEYVACQKLEAAVKAQQAERGSLVILDPKTGAIIAMCNAPTYDPNDYGNVDNVDVYNNSAIFNAYEPGSVFKAITMAAALDTGKITPDTMWDDPGSVTIGTFTIRNSDLKAHGPVSMTDILAYSLNTGLVEVSRRLGTPAFLKYVRDFGFGEKTDITLQSEVPGNIDSLTRKGDIWPATASFGQGLTVTLLQLASAYGAIANRGVLMKPYIVSEVRGSDGQVETTKPLSVRQVITAHTANLLTGMLVAVVERGHGKRAGVPGYWIGGKTGTAQIPSADGTGYEVGPTIGTFAGFGPVDDPKFVMAVRVDRPKDVQFAETSAAPLFGDIAKFLMDYYRIPPSRK